jgi:hypothetical protein
MTEPGQIGCPGEAVRAQLEKISRHPLFVRSARVRRFLEFTVDYLLAGRAGELKEYVIGAEVFDRGEAYDPRLDPIVRVEARRVRAKLQAYYSSDGANDELVIGYPSGSYAPEVKFREAGPRRLPLTAVLPFTSRVERWCRHGQAETDCRRARRRRSRPS